MTEAVTVTPQAGRDDDGNPVTGGDPVVLEAFLVAPGNTTLQFTDSGNVDSADFTVYFLQSVSINDGDLIEVRDRTCIARVQKWIDPWDTGAPLDSTVVLCTSDTGAS